MQIARALEKMTTADFRRIEKATLDFSPYYEAEKNACRRCNDAAKEFRSFKSENLRSSVECAREIRRAKRVLLNARTKSVRARAEVKLEHFQRIEADLNARAQKLFEEERKAKNALDRAHFESFGERKKVYHSEMNVHMIADERFRKLAFVDVGEKRLGERGAERVAVSLGEDGELRYHAFVRGHRYAKVPTAPESAAAHKETRPAEDWRTEFK
ncbi:hypothetical protein MHBO_002838 [Bonamia ostreae]|uniref:Uncharacterized protein n=1 Tax=Bonamia ostreae TaxID=126728 RepID=A0ABV2ANR5_9EUKA